MPTLRLAVIRILDFHPGRRFGPVRFHLQLRHSAFEILPAYFPEQVHAVPLDVGDVQQPRRLRRHERPENPLAFDQGQLAQVAPVQPEAIEGVVVWLLAAVEQRVEPCAAVAVQANDLAVQDGAVLPEGCGQAGT